MTQTIPRRRVTTIAPDTLTDDSVELEPGVFEVPDEEEGSRVEERAPKIPTPTISEHVDSAKERIERTRERLRALPKLGRGSGARKPGVKRPRASVEGLISSVWSIAARVVTPIAWPVANVLQLQSPVAGKILEESVRNTAIDTVLQPFARFTKGSEVVTALLGPPILVGIACARPESQPIVEPLLREALRTWLRVAGPKMIEKAEEEAEFQKEYGQTIDDMVAAIFTPPPGMRVADNATVDGTVPV